MSLPLDFDEAEVARLASGLSLALPRAPHRGRVGEVRAASAGSALDVQDLTLVPGR